MKNRIALYSVLFLPALVSAQSEQVRPNILWLTYEDTSPQFIGCYGNRDAKTPVIDRLAGEGVRFDAAFSTGAVSSPSRFCLFTGIRPTTMGTGNHRSSYPVPADVEGFPFYLREAGYYTTNNVKTDYNFAGAKEAETRAWNESSVTADWRGRQPGQPFFAIYNSPSSHQSRTMTNRWSTYEKQVLAHLTETEKTVGGTLEMPAMYADTPEMQKHLSRVYNSITLTDKEFGVWLDKLEKDGLKDSTIVFCFSDHGEGMPRGKGSALGMGYRVPFIAWFPPMYAHLSPWGTGGVVTEELISFEDMAATVLSLAGVAPGKYMEGRPFLGNRRTEPKEYVYMAVDRVGENGEFSRSVTDGHYLYTRVFTNYQPFVYWQQYYDISDIQQAMRRDLKAGRLNAVQSSIFEPRAKEYLYDLKNDRWETTNLIADRQLKKQAEGMRNALKTFLISKKDAHFIPEYYYLENGETTPYELRLNTSLYPVGQVQQVAWMSGEGRAVIDRQISLLGHENPLVRYWAAVGLYAQQEGVAGKEKELMKRLQLLGDEPAKPFLAATLYKYCGNEAAGKALEQLIGCDNNELVRCALQVSMYLPKEQQAHLLPLVQSMSGKKRGGDIDNFVQLFLLDVAGVKLRTEHEW